MFLITKQERDAILDRLPWAEIKATRHKYYLVGTITSEPTRLLFSMRGITPPPSRKDQARNNYRQYK